MSLWEVNPGMDTERAPAFDEVRMLAWSLLQQIEKSGTFADLLIDQTFAQNSRLRPLDRAFIMELVLGTLRWRGRLDFAIHRLSKLPEKKIDPRVFNLLRMGAYQILFLDRVPVSAAINESVQLAKAIFKNEKISGFTNAILRSLARAKNYEALPSFEQNPVDYLTQTLSHPRWMVERWVKEFGLEMARKICIANNRRPPFTVRVNTLKVSREAVQKKIKALGLELQPTTFAPEGLVFAESFPPAQDVLFQEGLYFVQDEASQIVSHLLTPQAGERVLDVCAAPGGKSTHLAQLMEDRGEIIAMDLHGPKVNLIRDNCRRMGLSIIKAWRGDASKSLPFSPEMTLDRILVDAPCTGLGTLHRHPEAKWRLKPDDPLRLGHLQMALLKNVCSRLKPGGVLVYSTCTMTQEENDSVVETFLKTHGDFRLEDLRSVVPNAWAPLIDTQGFLRTYPEMIISRDDYRLDGFFAARMRKRE